MLGPVSCSVDTHTQRCDATVLVLSVFSSSFYILNMADMSSCKACSAHHVPAASHTKHVCHGTVVRASFVQGEGKVAVSKLRKRVLPKSKRQGYKEVGKERASSRARPGTSASSCHSRLTDSLAATCEKRLIAYVMDSTAVAVVSAEELQLCK